MLCIGLFAILWFIYFFCLYLAGERAASASRIIAEMHNNCYTEYKGKPKRTFVCKYCGCVFETNKYTASPSQITVIGSEENYIGMGPLGLTYHSECPNCGRDWVKEKKE